MNQIEKIALIRQYIGSILGRSDPALESASGALEVAKPALEAAARESPAAGSVAVEKLLEDRMEYSAEEVFALEAVILPKLRPVVFVRSRSDSRGTQTYDDLPSIYAHLNESGPRSIIEPCLTSIGRIEVPALPHYPFGGTGFLVGPGLLMTNRHVAELFTKGIGLQSNLLFNHGDGAVDFYRFIDSESTDRSAYFEVEKVVMIHPYWDMAILGVAGLEHLTPLTLSHRTPEELRGHEVMVVGYPTMDRMGYTDLLVQIEVFGGIFDVKRCQPGLLGNRAKFSSYKRIVDTVTHDSSTLPGNSGSAVLDVATGDIVALHFAGEYLKANYAVPSYELARDQRVVDAGVSFTGPVDTTAEWESLWQAAQSESPVSLASRKSGAAGRDSWGEAKAVLVPEQRTLEFTIPLKISISLGESGQSEGEGITPSE